MSATPGPWKLQETHAGGMILLRGDHHTHPQTHLQILPVEDARLIAAAPDLLEACEDALAFVIAWSAHYAIEYEVSKKFGPGPDDWHPMHRESFDKLRAAISKATESSIDSAQLNVLDTEVEA